MRAWALPLFFLLGGPLLFAQEICNNGVDDDGDGLIDLNDWSDCSCSRSSSILSLLPNPSFELFEGSANGCTSQQPGGLPDAVNQANCLTGWQRASLGTTDTWNAFTLPGYGPYFPAALPQPLPSGTGVAGFWIGVRDEEESVFHNRDKSTTSRYREYLAACLNDGNTLIEGSDYRLTFSLGFIMPQIAGTADPVQVGSPDSIELSIYGIRTCGQLNFGGFFGCPEEAGAEGYELIENITVTGSPGNWTAASLDFRSPGDYSAFAIGGSCAADRKRPGNANYRNYYFIDDLILNHPEAFAVPTPGPIEVAGLTVCDTVTLTARSAPAGSYQWYRNGVAIDGQTDNQLTLAPDLRIDGEYVLRVTTAEGCAVSDPAMIQRPIVRDHLPDTIAICRLGDTVYVSSGLSSGASYLWSDGSTGARFPVASPGTYSVTVTEACVAHTESFTVALAPPFTYSVTLSPANACLGDTITVTLSSNFFRPQYTFRSLPSGAGLVSSGGRVTVVVGEHDALLAFVGNECQRARDTIVLPQGLPFPTPRASITDLTCPGGTGSIEVDLGGQSTTSISWFDEEERLIETGTPVLEVTRAGRYRLLLSDGVRCDQTYDYTVSQGEEPQLQLTTVQPFCGQGGSIAVDTTGMTAGYRIHWELDGQLLATSEGTFKIDRPLVGRYTAVVTTPGGCELRKTVVIAMPSAIVAETDYRFTDCDREDGGMLWVTATGGLRPYRYQLEGGAGQRDSTFTGLTPGSYRVEVTDATGCSLLTDTVTLSKPRRVPIELGTDISLRPGESAQLTAKVNGTDRPGGSLAWYPAAGLSCSDCPQPTVSPAYSTTYTVTYTTLDNCTSSDRLLVTVDERPAVYLPTGFSPNGDGTNDRFTPLLGSGALALTELNIYDRWGELLWQKSTTEQLAWDGTFRGKPLPNGVYAYTGEVLLATGSRRRIDGAVTLLR